MRTIVGYMLLALVFPYAFYAYFHPPASSHAMGIMALAIAGGLFLRRGRDDRRRRTETVEPVPAPAIETPVQPSPKVPAFEASTSRPEEPAAADPEEGPRRERDVMLPPAPDRSVMRPVLKLVHTDGKRTDVRDFRRKAAK